LIVADQRKKFTRTGTPQIAQEKQPIVADAYYTIREITDLRSPWYVASASTIFRALRRGDLKANYLGRKTLLKGSSIHAWLEGKQGRGTP